MTLRVELVHPALTDPTRAALRGRFVLPEGVAPVPETATDEMSDPKWLADLGCDHRMPRPHLESLI